MLLVGLGEPSFEIVAHQRDREVGGALHHAHAHRRQGGGELARALHVDCLDADAAALEILHGGFGRNAEARPIAGDSAGAGTGRGARGRHHMAALDQPSQGFLDLVGWKIPRQRAHELREALAAFSDRGGERDIELAVQKELAILRIEAHRIGRQHIDGEIRRKLRHAVAVDADGSVLAAARRAAGPRAFPIVATRADRHWIPLLTN